MGSRVSTHRRDPPNQSNRRARFRWFRRVFVSAADASPDAKWPSTVVPRPGAEMIRSSPPAARIRSRMPVSPWVDRTAGRVEPVTVVGDAEPQPATGSLVVGGLHRDDRAPRVPVGVVDRLGAAEVDRRLDRGRVPAQALHVDRARQDRAAGRRRQGPDQAALAEDRRVDAVRQVAQVADGGLELVLQAVHDGAGLRRVLVPQPGHPAEVDGDRGEPLLRPVVQVALDRAPGLDGRHREPGARLLELVGAVTEPDDVVAQARDEHA